MTTHQVTLTVPNDLWTWAQHESGQATPFVFLRSVFLTAAAQRMTQGDEQAGQSMRTLGEWAQLFQEEPAAAAERQEEKPPRATRIRLNHATSCTRCRRPLSVGVHAWYYTDARGYRQIDCADCRDLLELGEQGEP